MTKPAARKSTCIFMAKRFPKPLVNRSSPCIAARLTDAEDNGIIKRPFYVFDFEGALHMRIITGSARGRRLLTLEGEHVRPTTERVKEALFSILQFQIEGRRVLDLFAGSGQLGLEALSRGAREAVFVDAGKEPISIIEKNIASTGLGERAKVLHMDYAAFLLRRNEPFDIAF